jgi:ParB family transcriptional regulator, chromosome partitioning protein
MKIEQKSIDLLIPYAKNARIHNEAQIAQIAGSIKEFGFNNPILIDKDNGIIAGHGRVMAARKLGLKEVPTIQLDHLSETQRRAFILADNRIAMNSHWDEEILSLELSDLKDALDLTDLGFEVPELDKLMNGILPLDEMPDLRIGDREPIQQMTFKLHDDQVDTVDQAIEYVKKNFDIKNELNENSNGNALAMMAELFMTQNAHG